MKTGNQINIGQMNNNQFMMNQMMMNPTLVSQYMNQCYNNNCMNMNNQCYSNRGMNPGMNQCYNNNGMNMNNQCYNNQGMNPGMNQGFNNQGMNPGMNQGFNNQDMNPGMNQGFNNQDMNPGMNLDMNQDMNNTNSMQARLLKEYQLCQDDNDLIQIGCNFGLENENLFTWRVTMVGPKNTPYEGGLFTIIITFPENYPSRGPEFKFKNKIYHLNVDFEKDFGHICINNLNSWRTTGKVKDKSFYTVKQALFDIFCLFFNQGVDSAYKEEMAVEYLKNRDKFNEEARRWTKEYASITAK